MLERGYQGSPSKLCLESDSVFFPLISPRDGPGGVLSPDFSVYKSGAGKGKGGDASANKPVTTVLYEG